MTELHGGFIMGGMQFKDHFSRLAAQYSAFRPGYPRELFDYLAGLCGQRRLAWDCACGNGQASVPLAGRFDAVIATDASGQQIAAAASHPRIVYHVAAAEHSGIEAGSVDLVTVAQALHWFDVAAFYREVDRVLCPRGVLAVWAYGNCVVDSPKVTAVVEKLYGDTLGAYWPPERRHIEAGYQTLEFPFAEIVSPAFEMRELWTLEQLLGYLRSWSATGKYVKEHGEDPVTAAGKALERIWGGSATQRTIVWPFTLRVGRKP